MLATGGGFLEPAVCSGGVTVGRVARRSRGVAVDGVETGDGSRLLSAQWSEEYKTLNAFFNQIIESTNRTYFPGLHLRGLDSEQADQVSGLHASVSTADVSSLFPQQLEFRRLHSCNPLSRWNSFSSTPKEVRNSHPNKKEVPQNSRCTDNGLADYWCRIIGRYWQNTSNRKVKFTISTVHKLNNALGI